MKNKFGFPQKTDEPETHTEEKVVEPSVDNTPEVVALKAEEEAKAKREEEAKKAEADKKPLLKDEEASTLARYRTQGTLSQQEALDYHRLLNVAGE